MSTGELYVCRCTATVGASPELCPECGRESEPWRDDERRLNEGDAPRAPESRSTPQSRTLSDLAQLAEEDPIAWLVPHTIIEGGIHVIHGKEESFKTRLTLQLLEALNLGGCFLVWELPGGKRVGFAELEMTETMFKGIAHAFLRPVRVKPDIKVLTEEERKAVLNGATARARVAVLAKWARANRLDVIAIDSAAKLFPPGANTGSQPDVSDVFSQLQQVGCTVILIAHPRKRGQAVDPTAAPHGNEEIAGSGRFAQDPDIVLEMRRPNGRGPLVILSWGKNRMDFKPDALRVFFDAVEHRLYPIHPFLHLLPASREGLVEESARRFDWKTATVDSWIKSLKNLHDVSNRPVATETYQARQAVFSLADPPVSLANVVENSDWNQRSYENEIPSLESGRNDVSNTSACDTPTGHVESADD